MHNFGSNEQFFSPIMERTSVCAVCYNFCIKTMFNSSLTPICFIFVYWCPNTISISFRLTVTRRVSLVEQVEHYVIKFVSDLRQVRGFLWILRFHPPIKLTATISLKYCFLKVAFNTIKQTFKHYSAS